MYVHEEKNDLFLCSSSGGNYDGTTCIQILFTCSSRSRMQRKPSSLFGLAFEFYDNSSPEQVPSGSKNISTMV
ncbi:hypothetical protein T06_2174 [Trichinella sp. T6]|nr:hypothetical protein T06_2174 [Trichinella sp. T6]